MRVRVPGYRAASVHRLAGDGSAGYLDVFASTEYRDIDATHTTRILPGLTLVGPPSTVSGATVTLQVSDAGAAMAGAKVTFRGVSAVTDEKGRATLPIKGGQGTASVVATRAGYTRDAIPLKVRF